ncbi:Decarboxylase NovR [Variovorax paradoxus]|jgi:L-fuculose-phosphate aldolase|uniref:Decarboxylase NovR n=2 Tax=Variovorax paradoxus TaxID=34073 RepID=A0A679JAX7_VARPD|nr:Decarboxylase NovR [Variovorax paradoxus]
MTHDTMNAPDRAQLRDTVNATLGSPLRPAPEWTLAQKMAIACRYLAQQEHCETLAGQMTVRLGEGRFATTPLGVSFDEMRPGDILVVDDELALLEGRGMANPATRFHMWVYRARPDVACIIHTHPPATSALSMIEEPLVVAHMDQTPFFNDCAFLKEWPGLPIADDEGVVISAALGGKRSILLAHHGLLTACATLEESTYMAVLLEQAARRQLMAAAAGTVHPVADALAQESHDFLLKPSIVNATFAMYARRVLRAGHPQDDFLADPGG